jgi:hypothetical protein
MEIFKAKKIDFEYAREIMHRDAFAELRTMFSLTGQSHERTIEWLEVNRAKRLEILEAKRPAKPVTGTLL